MEDLEKKFTDEEIGRLVNGWAWTLDYWRHPDETDREIARKLGGTITDDRTVVLPGGITRITES